MEQAQADPLAENNPESLYDPSTTKIIGETVLKSLSADLQIKDINGLGELLRSSDFEVQQGVFERKDVSNWEKADYIKYGRWLVLTAHHSENIQDKAINGAVITRAYRLGIGPSVRKTKNVFGSLSSFYAELGEINTHRTHNFQSWGHEDFIDYLKKVGSRLEKPPTRSIINQLSKSNLMNPSSSIIYERFSEIGGYNKALELAGFVVVSNWSNEDYLRWGVQFMEANNGLLPSSRHIEYLSSQKVGPSGKVVATKFGRVINYQNLVVQLYKESQDEQSANASKLLQEAEEDLKRGVFPPELFSSNCSDDEKIRRIAKYRVVDFLLSHNAEQSKLSISTEANKSVKALGFVKSIRRVNAAVTAGDIESTALYLGVFDYIWPMDDYKVKLKIPEKLMPTNRTTPTFDEIVTAGVNFASEYGRPPSKKDIDRKKALVSSRTIQRYFGSISKYQEIVTAELVKEIFQSTEQAEELLAA